MKKRFLKNLTAAAAVSAMLLSAVSYGAETPEVPETESEFITVSIPYEATGKTEYDYTKTVLLRYKDTKQPIALSLYFNGDVNGTIPKENKDREVEIFFPEKIKFTDEMPPEAENSNSYEIYIIKKLAERGIIKGDDMGRALPGKNITRAELAAMILRFLGIDPSDKADSGFSDVPKDEWYAKTVAKAKEKGIINGDSETLFSPERNVSREEAIAMAARALWRTGMQDENKDAAQADFDREGNVKDADKVSSWAYSAYAQLKYGVPADYKESEELDAEGIPIDYTYLNPQKPITRFETAEILDRICENFQVYPSELAKKYGFDKKMPVIDGSTSTYPFTEAIYNVMFSNGFESKEKPKKHSKSHVSYEKLIAGERDVIIASVYPAEDILELAKSKGVELELIPIAYDAMVFFTNSENTVSNLTQKQISEIYVDNKYDNWKELGGEDMPLYPYARNYDSGSHAQMQRHFLNGKDINDKIRKETTSVSMSNVLTDVMGCLGTEPKGYGLGYSIYYYFNNMDLFYNTKTELKLLSIDGIEPNDETIANGTYPLSNNTYVVLRKDTPENSPARKLAEFMLTPEGQECVSMAGFGPLKK